MWLKRKRFGKSNGDSIPLERHNLLTAKSNFFVREAYKTLRTNVSFALAEQEGCPVIMVTSALQGEGKSITALNLAISYAMTDCKVLIIDCDLRRPKMARLLNARNAVGLSNLIMNPDLRDKAICHTQINGVDAILSGDIPPNPSELLGSDSMRQLVDRMAERYDYILIDMPPVGIVSDVCVVAEMLDGVLFLVRQNESEKDAVSRSVKQLELANAKLLGFVMNGVGEEKRKGYKGYKKYGYRYYRYYGHYGRTEKPQDEEGGADD